LSFKEIFCKETPLERTDTMAKVLYLNFIIDFIFSRRLIIDIHSVLGLMHRAYVGDITDVSEVHAPPSS
jgi:hypothetical protein